jgi:hypothetical protein
VEGTIERKKTKKHKGEIHMHCIHNFVVDEKVARDTVLAQASSYADDEGDHKGQIHNIRWFDKTICDNEESAEEFIHNHDNGWYDNLAVRFYSYPRMKKSKRLETLEERLATLHSRLRTMENTNYTDTLTSTEFVGCKCCGSKIATKYLKGNRCPICGADMRPKTTLDRLSALKERIENTKAEIHEEKVSLQKKQRKNAVVKWLVKIEFHS